jgi:microcystin-dependent protein
MTVISKSAILMTAMASLSFTHLTQANCVPEPYIGSVCMTAATFCPRGFAEANGQLLAISSNSALFSLLGTNYGGDGRTTFGLPDLRGRTPVGIGTGPGLQNIRQGAMPGREFITLNLLNLPSHTHSATVSSPVTVNVSIPVVPNSGSNVTTPSDSQNYLAASPGGPNAAAIWAAQNTETVAQVGGVSASGAVTGAVTVGNTGGSQSFESRPPQTGMRYCVALVGLFPPRD